MNEHDIFNKLIIILMDLTILYTNDLTVATRFIEDLKYKDEDLCELIFEIEEEFNVTATEEEIKRLSTIGSMCKLIEFRMQNPT